MGIRRKAREAALQLLYAWDLSQGQGPQSFAVATRETHLPVIGAGEKGSRLEGLSAFCDLLVKGVIEHQAALDPLLEATATHWRLSRMDVVDRNLLRLGAYEIFHCPDIPVQVTLNEVIELAKKFSTLQSAAFINGILDRIAKKNNSS